MARLGDVFSLFRNGAPIKQTDGANGIPITRIETISDREVNRGKLGYADIYYITKYSDYILKDKDILMSHINSEKHLGKVALYNQNEAEQIIHGMNLVFLRADTAYLLPRYAIHFFNSPAFLNQIPNITRKSVNQASFTITALKELNISLPPKDTQYHIASILDKVDGIIVLRKQQLDKLDELVKARFVEMFGDVEINPYHWDIATLTDITIGKLYYGSGAAATDYDSETRYVRITDITDNGELSTDIKSPDRIDEKYLLHDGDILFVRTGATVGKAFMCKENYGRCIYAGFLIRLVPNRKKCRRSMCLPLLNLTFILDLLLLHKE